VTTRTGLAPSVKNPAMKPNETPVCPRCNRNNEVRKVADDVTGALGPHAPAREGYVLDGIVIRPGSFDWYCEFCSESFGGARINWGRFLTNRTQ